MHFSMENELRGIGAWKERLGKAIIVPVVIFLVFGLTMLWDAWEALLFYMHAVSLARMPGAPSWIVIHLSLFAGMKIFIAGTTIFLSVFLLRRLVMHGWMAAAYAAFFLILVFPFSILRTGFFVLSGRTSIPIAGFIDGFLHSPQEYAVVGIFQLVVLGMFLVCAHSPRFSDTLWRAAFLPVVACMYLLLGFGFLPTVFLKLLFAGSCVLLLFSLYAIRQYAQEDAR